MAVTSESTLKELVNETTVIKNDLVSCRNTLKTNLSDKGVDVASVNKMQGLVEKVNELVSIESQLSFRLFSLRSSSIFEYEPNSFRVVRVGENGKKQKDSTHDSVGVGAGFDGTKLRLFSKTRDVSNSYREVGFFEHNSDTLDASTTPIKTSYSSESFGALSAGFDGTKLRLFDYNSNNRMLELNVDTLDVIKTQNFAANNIGSFGAGFDGKKLRMFIHYSNSSSNEYKLYEVNPDTLSVIKANTSFPVNGIIDLGAGFDGTKLRLFACKEREILEIDSKTLSVIRTVNVTWTGIGFDTCRGIDCGHSYEKFIKKDNKTYRLMEV